MHIYIYIYNRNDPKLTNLLLKVSRHECRFSSNTKILDRSNTLILDKVWHIAIGTNCHLSFTNYPVGFLYN